MAAHSMTLSYRASSCLSALFGFGNGDVELAEESAELFVRPKEIFASIRILTQTVTLIQEPGDLKPFAQPLVVVLDLNVRHMNVIDSRCTALRVSEAVSSTAFAGTLPLRVSHPRVQFGPGIVVDAYSRPNGCH